MSDTQFTGIFCDDIRREVGGKVSLIGCYSDKMLVPNFPVKLAKLCVHFTLTSTDLSKNTPITIQTKKGGHVIFNYVMNLESTDEDKDKVTLRGGFELSMLDIKEPTTLALNLVFDDKSFDGPTLVVDKMPTTNPTKA